MASHHLAIMLSDLGFEDDATAVEKALSGGQETVALLAALSAINGALLMLRRHHRALQHTSAAFEAGQLRGLEEDIEKRLVELKRIFGDRKDSYGIATR